ncbi:DoxX protein [Sorangium cellulosum]|uniref:DoxX protein n=1 Tax=Sorangium cellulosum TaxID=56 RepID=A0A2L0ESS9_SORCE|nr:DoxX family protein [Sorangium cellulosum]AUX42349.1 DoxX protein [Sorangium cellulosum]
MLGRKRFGKRRSSLADAGLLVIRVAAGGLLAGHGAQKLFGWFGGHGLDGTSMWIESMGMRPARLWGVLAGLAELGGGALTSLGFLGPAGPLGILASMGMATAKVHLHKPIWTTSGGAELPVTNMAIAAALLLSGPGRFSLDEALRLDVPRWVALPGLAAVGIGIGIGLQGSSPEQATTSPEVAGAGLQAGEQAAHPI